MDNTSDRRITVFTGHYGSGKTEISINFALLLKKQYDQMALVDLDFVNPYFRSREARKMLSEEGIRVIASAEEYFDTDVPAFSPQINGVLKDRETRVIVDLGGDEVGARAAGRFRNHIRDDEYEMFFVLNPYRPYMAEVTDIEELLNKIQASSRLQVTALVSNPNLAAETGIQDVLAGHDRVKEIGRQLSLPVKMLVLEEKFQDSPQIQELNTPVLNLRRVMLNPWEQ